MSNNLNKNKIFEKINAKIDENDILKSLSKEYDFVNEILDFNEFNISDRLEKNSYYQEKFRMLYISEMQKLNKLENKFSETTGELYDYYKYKDSRDLSKTEIERYYLPSDPKLIKLKKLVEFQKTKVEFFSAVTESLKSQGFNMKTFIENLKIGG